VAPIILSASTVLCVVAVVGQMLRVGAMGGESDPAARGGALPDREERRRHLVWRSFYVNPDDPRGWVRKTWGVGWTVNFRTMRNVRVFVTLIACTLASAIGLAVSAARCG